ncbi:S41 family peptidase [Bacteroides sp. OttesenSCG-928-E20]|nr:S41 family peptidase [Bacteroides sp. OttesenSCG-928-N06]MDL2299727.1 S41 family peptidase [Bacteroides sp. OttesenSCG-928-E20]
MKARFTYLCFLLLDLFSSCIGELKVENDSMGNFNELWRIIDEKYCFFDYKEIDWDEVYNIYKPQITHNMDKYDLFYKLGDMLKELKDGHVNLYSSEGLLSYYSWHEDSPENFNWFIIQQHYLKHNYHSTGAVKYQIMDNYIGYMYVENFIEDIGSANLDYIINYFHPCKGIIIDVRSNGGGSITNASRLASRFAKEKTHTGYICHKTGKGHNDFSTPQPIYLTPSGKASWERKVVVLTNRQTYSAANEFVNSMSYLDNVTIVGDITGGGSGLPFHSELPNGWAVRFSTSPLFNVTMEHTEFGIHPDIKVDMNKDDNTNKMDTILETAIQLLSNL